MSSCSASNTQGSCTPSWFAFPNKDTDGAQSPTVPQLLKSIGKAKSKADKVKFRAKIITLEFGCKLASSDYKLSKIAKKRKWPPCL